MEPFRDETELIAELRALRPRPRAVFAADLDERAATGFPRRSPLGDSPLTEALARLRDLSPRRLLLSTGTAALAAVALATVVVIGNEPGGEMQPLEHDGVARRNAAESPFLFDAPVGLAHGDGYLSKEEDAGPPTRAASPHATQSAGKASAEVELATGPVTAGAAHRDVERSAEIVLAANPADIAEDSAAVFDAVHAANGIVLHSSTVEGAGGRAGARFDLLIPSGRLADALAAFSAIDEVRSRHEATADITAPTVDTRERLEDSRARIDGLLAQLSAAETESEREIVETELSAERRRAASLRAQLAHLDRRTSLSRVSVRIETGGAASSSEGGAWGIGDAFHDAGHILAIAAAVTLVSLAVLGPIALIALLAWLAQRTWARRGRERALGSDTP